MKTLSNYSTIIILLSLFCTFCNSPQKNNENSIIKNSIIEEENTPSKVSYHLLTIRDEIAYYEDRPYTGFVFKKDETGRTQAEANLLNGKPEGIRRMYHENGQMESEVNFSEGKMNGKLREFYDNGKLSLEVNMKDGERDGLLCNYRKNGSLLINKNYINGKIEGISKTYDENGQLQSECIYENGEELFTTWFYKNGKKAAEDNNRKDREWFRREYDKNGNLTYESHKNGEFGVRNSVYE